LPARRRGGRGDVHSRAGEFVQRIRHRSHAIAVLDQKGAFRADELPATFLRGALQSRGILRHQLELRLSLPRRETEIRKKVHSRLLVLRQDLARFARIVRDGYVEVLDSWYGIGHNPPPIIRPSIRPVALRPRRAGSPRGAYPD